MDLNSISSPFSGPITRNDYSTSCGGGSAGESIFYLDLQPGKALSIAQTTNQFDSYHQLAYGGSCPGNTSIACVDDSDLQTLTWANNFDAVERVYFMIDAYSGDYGYFTIEWGIFQGNKFEV